MQSIERGLSKTLALQRWQQELDNLQLNYTIKREGPAFYKTPFCQLYRQDGTKVAEGVGKGLDPSQAELSAKFEALENYLQSNTAAVQHLTIAEANTNYTHLPFRAERNFYKNELNNPIKLPWLCYRNLNSENEYAVLRAAIDLPYMKSSCGEEQALYKHYRVFASTNGLASGTSFDEALIHAVTEIIERDALSYFLLDTFLLKKPVSIVNKESLPGTLRDLVENVERQYNDELLLCSMPSRMNIPVYCACFQHAKNNNSQIKGFGASMITDYALERAISEAIQSMHVSEFNPKIKQNSDNLPINEFPILTQCYHFSLHAIKNQQTVNFVSHINEYIELSLDEYKKQLLEKVYLSGNEIIYHNVYESSTGIHVLRAIIPSMEEFFHVTNGRVMSPNPVTQQYIKHHVKSC